MNDNGTDTKYRLMPLDEGGLVYIGVDMTNGNHSAIFFVSEEDVDDCIQKEGDFRFWLTIKELAFTTGHGLDAMDTDFETEPCAIINDRRYWVKAWNDSFDRALVILIDKLIAVRMKNISRVSLTLQLEMPI